MEVALDKTLFELLQGDHSGKVLADLIAEWRELNVQLDAQKSELVAAGREADWLRAQHAMHVAHEVIESSAALKRL
jgi:hypothetical protein